MNEAWTLLWISRVPGAFRSENTNTLTTTSLIPFGRHQNFHQFSFIFHSFIFYIFLVYFKNCACTLATFGLPTDAVLKKFPTNFKRVLRKRNVFVCKLRKTYVFFEDMQTINTCILLKLIFFSHAFRFKWSLFLSEKSLY